MKQGNRAATLVLHLGALGDLILAVPALVELARNGPLEAWGPSLERLSVAQAPRGPIARVERLPHGLFAERGSGLAGEEELERRLRGFGRIVAFARDDGGPLGERVRAAGGVLIPPFPHASDPARGTAGELDAELHATDFLRSELSRRGLLAGGPRGSDFLVGGLSGGLKAEEPRGLPFLHATEGDRERGRGLLAARGIPGPVVVVQPGAGGRGKRWSPRHLSAVAREVAARLGGPRGPLTVVCLLGPAELDGPPDPALRLPGVASAVIEAPETAELLGLLALARLYIGNDSGVTHLAAALGTAVGAVFGPTSPARWGPRGRGPVVVVRAPRGDLEALEPPAVLAALEPLLRAGLTGGRPLG